MKKLLLLSALLSAVCFTACFNNKKESSEVVSVKTTDTVKKEQSEIGKYVYVDSKGTLHTDRYCYSKPTNDNTYGRHGSYSPILIIATDTLKRSHYKMVCPDCISDEDYEMIIYKIDPKLNQIAINNQRKVYKALHGKYSDIPDNFTQFQKIITDTNTLKIFYERLEQDETPFLPKFESFVVELGLNPNKPAKFKLIIL